MDSLRLPAALEATQSILIAGAGGGFDLYTGLPMYERLRSLGKRVYLANLSFTYLGGTNARILTPALYAVDASTSGEERYFPERTLAGFLSRRGESVTIYAFERMGVQAVRDGYRYLVNSLALDAIVLTDGGTDILMRGDEAMLGTPGEDMMSLAAVAGLDVPTRIVTCLGFGVDCHHGLSHANWLENVAALMQTGGFLGAVALRKEMPEVQVYIDAVNAADAVTPDRPSIVNGSVVSAIEGRYGDYHRTTRTQSSKLFISPLMSILWAFDLAAVAKRNLYLDRLEHTRSIWDVLLAVESLRNEVKVRLAEPIPY